MAHGRAKCRLIAGPYDGDEGTFPTPLPDVLIVYPCTEGPHCIVGGLHWSTEEAFDEADAAGVFERYKKARKVEGVRIYVWTGAKLIRSAQERTSRPEPALA